MACKSGRDLKNLAAFVAWIVEIDVGIAHHQEIIKAKSRGVHLVNNASPGFKIVNGAWRGIN